MQIYKRESLAGSLFLSGCGGCRLKLMQKSITIAAAAGLALLACAASSLAADPIIDNERVAVWDTSSALPAAQHDFVAVSLDHKGHAKFGHKGDVPAKDGAHTIVVELKGVKVPPLENSSGLPLAFPRPRVQKLLENDQVVVWSYTWHSGQKTPMHFHDKDALVVYEATGALSSTTQDGKVVVNEYKDGEVRFNKRDRSHSELLVKGAMTAVITELK
jgi:hypothetical protein